MSAERRQRYAATRCTTAGCSLLAESRNGAGATGSDKYCDYCPTAHTWACLSRHTADERAAALRHQAAHDPTGDEQSTSGAMAAPREPSAVETVMNVYYFDSEVPRARPSSPGGDISPIPVTKALSTSTDAEATTSRVDAVTEAVLQAASGARRAAAENVADDTAMDARWMALARAGCSRKRTRQQQHTTKRSRRREPSAQRTAGSNLRQQRRQHQPCR